MTTTLQIADDPTLWVPAGPVDPSQLTGATVQVPIKAPIFGTLLISSRAASIALYDPGDSGPVPSDGISLVASLYVPTGADAAVNLNTYLLPPGTDLGKLTNEIAALMTEGKRQTITLGSGTARGTIILNGATLPFVVLAPVHK
jgi:hypothetical protein